MGCTSQLTYLKEKYYSILSELKHKHQVLNYYKQKLRSQPQLLEDLQNDIQGISKYLKAMYKHESYGLCNLSKLCESQDNIKKFDFIVYLDVHKEKIEEVLRYLERVHAKMLQYLSESMVQHLPQPSLQKRYSSKSLSDIIDRHTQKLFDFFSQDAKDANENQNILSCWSHNDVYEITDNTLLDGTNRSLIGSHSFYYHDLIWTLPTMIDHEVILSALQYNNDIQNKIKEWTGTIIENSREWTYSEFSYFSEEDAVSSFLWELVASYVAYSIYGNAYLESFFHETFGSFLGREFWNDSEEAIAQDFTFSQNQRRDMLLCRQILMLMFGPVQANLSKTEKRNTIESSDYLKWVSGYFNIASDYYQKLNRFTIEDWMKSIDEAEDKIETINGIFNDLATIFQDFQVMNGVLCMLLKHYHEDFKGIRASDIDTKRDYLEKLNSYIVWAQNIGKFIHAVLCSFENFTIENFIFNAPRASDFEKQILKDNPFFYEKNQSLLYTPIADTVWKKRFESLVENKLPHRSLLRKELLSALDNDGLTPYIMSQKRYWQKQMKETTPVTLGYFDDITFDNKETEMLLEDFEKNIESLFDLDDSHEDKKDIYFETKHALLRIDNESDNDLGNGAYLKMILQVYLRQSGDLKQIKQFVDNMKNINTKSYYAKEIYKSLGSEDFVCCFWFERGKQSNAWNIVETIETFNEVADTYMSVQLLPDSKIDEKIYIKQLWRLKDPISYDEFKEGILKISPNLSLEEKKNLQIYDIEGGFDFELWWDVDNFAPIKNTYNNMVEEIETVVSFVAVYDKKNRSKAIADSRLKAHKGGVRRGYER